MNPHHEKSDPAADEQAALWAAKLDGSVLSAAERTALDAWLAAAPAHRALLAGYCQFSADLEQQLPLLAGIQDSTAETNREFTTARPRPWLSRPMWVGAMLTAAAAAVAIALWPGRDLAQSENLATPIGQRRTIALADGSHVELNAQTNLQISFDRDARHARLAAGQAFFRVAKDPARPFVVETPAGSVRVTGTQFEVVCPAASTFAVTVLEGSVQVRPGGAGGEPHSLSAGDRFADGRVVALSPTELAAALAWRDGFVVFKDAPLHEALAYFARYYGRNISATPDAAELRLTARVSVDDLDDFLASLEQILPVRVTRDLHGNVQVALRKES